MLSASFRNQPSFPMEIKSNTRTTKLKNKTKTKTEKQKTNKQTSKKGKQQLPFCKNIFYFNIKLDPCSICTLLITFGHTQVDIKIFKVAVRRKRCNTPWIMIT